MGQAIAFWILAAIAVAAALSVVIMANVFRAAVSLILCFLAVAGIYVTLAADFLAAVQILVYVGAISVVIILAIMMTRDVQHGSPANKFRLPGFLVAVVITGAILWTLLKTNWQVAAEAASGPTTELLANQLFAGEGYILPVLIAGLVVLVAIIGAIVIAREK